MSARTQSTNSFLDALTGHPYNRFKQDPRFYWRYDFFYLLLSSALLVMMAMGARLGVFAPAFGAPALWWLGVWPVALFGLIWAHLVIHNCTHGNLPKSINRVVGEVLGVLVVVRFASWGVSHIRHHRYSDDRVKDPHPNFGSFVHTVKNTVTQVEQQLFEAYFETWGDTPENRQREKRRAMLSYGTNLLLIAVWFVLLGPWFTLLVFAPANILAGLFVIHFNWSTHNGERGTADADFEPVNLNHGYYKLGNMLFAGIYMHANHHKRPHLFNPVRWCNETYGPMAPTVTELTTRKSEQPA